MVCQKRSSGPSWCCCGVSWSLSPAQDKESWVTGWSCYAWSEVRNGDQDRGWRGPEEATVEYKLFWAEAIWVPKIPHLPKSRACQKNAVVINLGGSNHNLIFYQMRSGRCTQTLSQTITSASYSPKGLLPNFQKSHEFFCKWSFFPPPLKSHLISYKSPPSPIHSLLIWLILNASLSHIFL